MVTRQLTRGDQERGWARIAISPSILFITCCTLFADLQMLAHFPIYFQHTVFNHVGEAVWRKRWLRAV